MSEAMEKVFGLKELPLFPLPLVLLPNEVLPLHIFEPRYLQMLKDVEHTRSMFGVMLFDPAAELGDKPGTGRLGCSAEVRETQMMPDGRANIITSGVARFRLLDYAVTDAPYYVGEVDFFEDEPEDSESLVSLSGEVFELFKRVATAAFRMSGNPGQLPEIPEAKPEALSFLVSAAFNLDTELKYRMLEITSTSQRLAELKSILLQAVDKMEESADLHRLAQSNGHSSKRIDF